MVNDATNVEIPYLYSRLIDHLGEGAAQMPVVREAIALFQQPNLALAMNALLSSPNLSYEALGAVSPNRYSAPTLARLSRPKSAAEFADGPVEYTDVSISESERGSCVANGIFLIHHEGRRVAMLIHTREEGFRDFVRIEVMAAERTIAELFLRDFVRNVRNAEAFRGKVLSVCESCDGINVDFHKLPHIDRRKLILSDDLLCRIERHTLTFNKHAEKLRRAGQHLKRGLLLYGPPGTGKTLTAMYLASQMPQRTVFIVTGASVGAIQSVCALANTLTPATVILEDVDLIGQERKQQSVGANAVLFELLNQMDGLAEDADILFLLTTNHPETLESALAARPGRIDQALEIPPPDASCRRRLLDLYAAGLQTEVDDWDRFVARTNGVSAAFMRELLRKAAVYAAEEETSELVVKDRHLEEAVDDLLLSMNATMQRVLGVSSHSYRDVAPEAGSIEDDSEDENDIIVC